jgi:two-component system sensor histidine kinase/response regulator
LGLQLCADFARKIGGDVMVESTLGEGSTFSVLVPLKK